MYEKGQFRTKMGWKLYDHLGVPRGASKEEIKKAYKKRALETHPDRGGDQEQFKQVNHAYTILTEDETRARYDQLGDENFEASNHGGGGGGGMDAHDIFRQFFGHGFHFHGGGGGGGVAVTKRADHKHLFKINMHEAYTGIKKAIRVMLHKTCLKCQNTCYACQGQGQITEMRRMGFFTQMLTRPCNSCQGTGMIPKTGQTCIDCHGKTTYHEEKILELDIPAGVETGHIIVLEGMGEQPLRQGEIAGNLHIEVFVQPHEKFTREGNDLHLRVSVTLRQSIVGTKIDIPHFTGDFQVDTSELGILQPIKQYILKNRGMPLRDRSRKEYGNIVLQFEIIYPSTKPTPEHVKKIDEVFAEVGW